MHHGKNDDGLAEEFMAQVSEGALEKIGRHVDEKIAGEIVNKLGATGEFPGGRLNPLDEGELMYRVGVVRGKVAIDLGAPVSWVAFTAEQAVGLATALIDKARVISSEVDSQMRAIEADEARLIQSIEEAGGPE